MSNKAKTMKTLKNIPFLAVAFALMAALAPQVALAAQTGELQGYIVDESGMPIPGVRVILSSPQMIGGEKIQVSDGDGRFRFPTLEPGLYTVVLSHETYVGFKEESIEVGIGANVIRDYLLEPSVATADGGEVIRVVATAPMVDTTRTSQGLSIRPEFTDRTVTSRDYQGVSFFVPGVVNGASAPGNPSIHGGTPFSNVYLLDGLNITDPVTQTFSTNFNFDAIGELQVLTGGLDAEYGSTLGGLLNIVTKSGGDKFEADGSVYWEPKELYLTDPGESIDSNRLIANLTVGGPIIKKKLWFLASGQYIDSTSQTPLEAPVFPGIDELPARRFNAFYGLGKLTWSVLPWQKLSVLVQGDPTWITNEKQDPSAHPDAERQRFQGGVKIIGKSETTLSDNLLWQTMVGYGNNRIHIFPMSNDFTKPGHTNLQTGTATVNDTRLVDDNRYRLQLNSHLTYFLDDFFGDHEIKAGVEGTVAWYTTDDSVPGNAASCTEAVPALRGKPVAGCVFTDNGINRVGSRLDGPGDPFQITVFQDPLRKLVTSNLVSLFLQDTWRPFRSLTIRPGLRFDSSRGYNDELDGGEEIFNFNSLSPRVGVAWDPFGDGKTVVRGGYYMYHETGLLTIPDFVGRGQSSLTYQFDDVTGQYTRFVREQGGENAVIFKPGMTAPVMHEVIFGVQRELFDDTALAVDFTFRRRQNMFEDDESNVIWNERGNEAVGFVNGDPRFIFNVGTPAEAMGQYIGMDLIFQKRLSDNWQALATYTLARLEGTVENLVTYSFDNPRQREFEYGFLGDDIRHRARLTMSYDLPYGFQVGGTAIYQSGRPESKFFLNNFYGDFLDRRAARGFNPNNLDDPNDDTEIRLPDTFIVNTRLAWRLKELTTQDIWLIADVFNLLNTRPTTSIENRDLPPGSPTVFGQALSRGAPTNVSLALRYMF
jgi:hypothetical protein